MKQRLVALRSRKSKLNAAIAARFGEHVPYIYTLHMRHLSDAIEEADGFMRYETIPALLRNERIGHFLSRGEYYVGVIEAALEYAYKA